MMGSVAAFAALPPLAFKAASGAIPAWTRFENNTLTYFAPIAPGVESVEFRVSYNEAIGDIHKIVVHDTITDSVWGERGGLLLSKNSQFSLNVTLNRHADGNILVSPATTQPEIRHGIS